MLGDLLKELSSFLMTRGLVSGMACFGAVLVFCRSVL